MIVTDKVFSIATYDGPGKKFISATGGTWHMEGDNLIRSIEWNTADSAQVGKVTTARIALAKNKLTLNEVNEPWTRVDDGKNGDLTGAWVITGN